MSRASIALSGIEIGVGEGIEPLVSACQRHKAGAVELWTPHNLDRDNCRAVVARLGDCGVNLHCLSAGIELARDDYREAKRQQGMLIQLIELAAQLGVTRVNTYVGFSAVRDDDRLTERYLELVAPCLAMAEATGITILIENEFDAFGWDPAESDVSRRPAALASLLQASCSRALRTTFDPANWVCAGIDPLGTALPTLLPYIAHVHVKNICEIAPGASPTRGWRGYRDYGRYFSTCGFADGMVDWPAIIGALEQCGYDGVYCLEPHATASNRESAWRNFATALRKMLVTRNDP